MRGAPGCRVSFYQSNPEALERAVKWQIARDHLFPEGVCADLLRSDPQDRLAAAIKRELVEAVNRAVGL